jgi:SAM-dependent methyltransferase
MTSDARPTCPSCASGRVEIFYEVSGVPTNSVLLLESADEARAFPTGDIRLAFCENCGHVHNAAFDPKLTEYSGRYESTQGFSGTFNAFHQRLAQDMIDRFDLHGKEIIEIGCGNGEFLVLLCELGDNTGLGFDPAFLAGRIPIEPTTQIDFVADFYSETYGDRQADFVTCKMTLEHIIDAGRFIRSVRNAIADRLDTMVCFQIPNGRYVLGDLAFWDVYYEHCSYFSHGSLARLFRRERFEVLDLWTDYDDQYLMVAARPTVSSTDATLAAEDDMAELTAEVARFSREVPDAVARWQRELDAMHADGKRIVLWGGGSKGVAFLTTLGLTDQVAAVVDINPNKTGTFMAGTGHEILAPDGLIELQPDVVIVMNPIYIPEITRELTARGLAPEVRPVDAVTAR